MEDASSMNDDDSKNNNSKDDDEDMVKVYARPVKYKRYFKQAMEAGNVEKCQRLKTAFAIPFAAGLSGLLRAVIANASPTVTWFIATFPFPRLFPPTKQGGLIQWSNAILSAAIDNQNLPMLDALYEYGFMIQNNQVVVMKAIKKANLEILQYVLNRGADISHPKFLDMFFKSIAISQLSEETRYEFLRELLLRGAQIESNLDLLKTLWEDPIWYKSFRDVTIEHIKKRKPMGDIRLQADSTASQIRTAYGELILDNLLDKKLFYEYAVLPALGQNDEQFIELLQAEYGITLDRGLQTAMENKDLDAILALLNLGAKLQGVAVQGLDKIIQFPNTEMLRQVLQRGQPSSATLNAGLVTAVESDRFLSARLFIDHGARITVESSDLIAIAVRNNNPPMVRLLVERGQPTMESIQEGVLTAMSLNQDLTADFLRSFLYE